MTTAIQPVIFESSGGNGSGGLHLAAVEALEIARAELRLVTDRDFAATLIPQYEHESDEPPRDSTVGGRLDRYLYRAMTGTPHASDSPVVIGFVLDAGGGGLAMLNRAIVAMKPRHVEILLDPTASERLRRFASYATYHELLHILPLDTWSPSLWGLPHKQPSSVMRYETATAYVASGGTAYRRFATNSYLDGRSLHPAEIHRIRSAELLATVKAPVVVAPTVEPVIFTATDANEFAHGGGAGGGGGGGAILPTRPYEYKEPVDPEPVEMPRELASTTARVALLPHLFVPGKVAITGVRVDRRHGYVTEVYELRRSLGRE